MLEGLWLIHLGGYLRPNLYDVTFSYKLIVCNITLGFGRSKAIISIETFKP